MRSNRSTPRVVCPSRVDGGQSVATRDASGSPMQGLVVAVRWGAFEDATVELESIP